MSRIKIAGRSAVYHCMSRIVGGQRLLGDLEKEKLRQLLRQQAEFCGIQIITYCFLANHFHILVRVPAGEEASDARLVERARDFYGSNNLYVETLQRALKRDGNLPEDLRGALSSRMADVSVFMKELKQRFSKWYNRKHDRYGTLWAERFKSVLIEDVPSTMETVAAYIDLNPVRAGLVCDPKDYRWCGYAEAVAGNSRAREGLMDFSQSKDWKEAARAYRELLLVKSERAGRSGKEELSAEVIRKSLEREGELSLGEVLRLRVRYFSDGVVLGSRNYVNEVFMEFRERFGPRRKSGARRMRGPAALSKFFSLRDLRLDRVS